MANSASLHGLPDLSMKTGRQISSLYLPGWCHRKTLLTVHWHYLSILVLVPLLVQRTPLIHGDLFQDPNGCLESWRVLMFLKLWWGYVPIYPLWIENAFNILVVAPPLIFKTQLVQWGLRQSLCVEHLVIFTDSWADSENQNSCVR